MAVAAVLTGCKKEHIANEGGTGTLSLSVTGNSQEFTDVNVKAGEGEPTIDVNTFKVKITSKDGSYSREWEAFSEMESMLDSLPANILSLPLLHRVPKANGESLYTAGLKTLPSPSGAYPMSNWCAPSAI